MKTLDEAKKKLQAVIDDPKSTAEQVRRARKALARLEKGDDGEEDPAAKAQGAYIDRKMGLVDTSGVRNRGRSLELGPMTPAQARRRLAAIEGR